MKTNVSMAACLWHLCSPTSNRASWRRSQISCTGHGETTSHKVLLLTPLRGEWGSAEVGRDWLKHTASGCFLTPVFWVMLPLGPGQWLGVPCCSHCYAFVIYLWWLPPFVTFSMGFPTSSGDIRVACLSWNRKKFSFHTFETRICNMDRSRLNWSLSALHKYGLILLFEDKIGMK